MQVTDARKLSPEGQADLRRRVVAAVGSGVSQQEAARVFGISRRAVGVWVRAHRENGPEALNPGRRGRHPGDQYALSRRRQAELLADLASGPPERFGLEAALWSRRALTLHIEQRFGVHLSDATVGHYLTRWGLVGGEHRGRIPRATASARRRAEPPVELPPQTSAEAVRVMWRRPTPQFVGTALVPGPGAVERGPLLGEVGPPRQYLEVLLAQSSRGTAHFLVARRPYEAASVRDFGGRVARTLDHAVTLTVCQWPSDQGAALRLWCASPGPAVRICLD